MTFVGRVDGIVINFAHYSAIVFILMVLFVKGREHVVTASNSSYCTDIAAFFGPKLIWDGLVEAGPNKALSSHE